MNVFLLIIIENNLITIMILSMLEFMERNLYNLKLKKKKKTRQEEDIKMIRKIIILSNYKKIIIINKQS